mgnify:CR=1 FL=1
MSLVIITNALIVRMGTAAMMPEDVISLHAPENNFWLDQHVPADPKHTYQVAVVNLVLISTV